MSKSLVWEYFDKQTENRQGKEVPIAFCKYCNTSFRNNATRMVSHLLELCRGIPEETRATFHAKYLEKKGRWVEPIVKKPKLNSSLLSNQSTTSSIQPSFSSPCIERNDVKHFLNIAQRFLNGSGSSKCNGTFDSLYSVNVEDDHPFDPSSTTSNVGDLSDSPTIDIESDSNILDETNEPCTSLSLVNSSLTNIIWPINNKEDNTALMTSLRSAIQLPSSQTPESGALNTLDVQKNSNGELNLLLLKALSSENIPLTFVNNCYFKKFLTKLNPSFNVLSDPIVSPKVLNENERQNFSFAEFNHQTYVTENAVREAENVLLSVFNVNTKDGTYLNVFVYLPKPFILLNGEFLNKKSPDELVDLILEKVNAEKILASVCDNENAAFNAALSSKCPWVLTGDVLKNEINNMVEIMSASKCKLFNGNQKQIVTNILSSKVLQNPRFSSTKDEIIIEWAHWLAHTGIFSSQVRPYAWTPNVLAMDVYTWWNGFFADSKLLEVFSVVKYVESVQPTVINAWKTAEKIFDSEAQRLANIDLCSMLSNCVTMEFNRLSNNEELI